MNNGALASPVIPLIDTHAHLDLPEFDTDREEVLRRAREAGLSHLVTIGAAAGTDGARRALALAESHEWIYASVGLHPHEAKEYTDGDVRMLRDLARHPKVVAIGEIGLDYYRMLSPEESQRARFLEMIDLAEDLSLPILIHCRDAHGDVLEILREKKPGRLRAIHHCYSGDVTMAREVVSMGHLVSIAGVVTFKNAAKLHEVVRETPLEALVIETDCPFLAPVPYRGKRNEPAYVRYAAEKIAELKGLRIEEVARATTENAIRYLGLGDPSSAPSPAGEAK